MPKMCTWTKSISNFRIKDVSKYILSWFGIAGLLYPKTVDEKGNAIFGLSAKGGE